MKNYYITKQLIYVTVDEVTETGNHSVVDRRDNMITFKANVYTNALNNDPRSDYLCGIKVKDDVLVSIPFNTPSIIF